MRMFVELAMVCLSGIRLMATMSKVSMLDQTSLKMWLILGSPVIIIALMSTGRMLFFAIKTVLGWATRPSQEKKIVDTSASSVAPVPKEALIECSNCKARNTFRASTIERSSDLEEGLLEGVLICPDCGHVQHAYWMSKQLMAEKIKIFGVIAVLSRRRMPINFARVKELKEKYKNLFDIEQSKYQAIVGVKEIVEKDDEQR